MANLPPPQLSGVIYNENANRISVNWQPSDGQFYMIALFVQEKMLAEKRVIGFGGELIPEFKLKPNVLYQVKVAQTDGPVGQPGPFGPPVDVITEPFTQLQIVNDIDSLSVNWELPKLSNVNGGKVVILDKETGRPVHSEQVAGGGGRFAIAGILTQGASYSLIVYPTRGISQGPASSRVPIVQEVPTCTLMGYERSPDSRQSVVQAGINPPIPADMWVELTVYQGDAVLASNRLPSSSISVQLDHVLNPSYRYAGTLRYWLGNSAGPESAHEPVLVASPVIEQVEMKEAEAHVTWRHLPVDPQPIYGQVAVVQGETPVAQATVLGNKAKLPLPDKLDPKALYEVRINGLWGISRGPMSVKVPLLVDEPRVASVAYNGRTLLVAWHEEAGVGVTDYQVQVRQEGVLVRSAACQAQAQRAALAVQLDPASSYQVTLCPYAAHTWGKPGPAVDIIAAVPGVTSILTDASSIQVQIEEPALQAAITGYRGHLYEGDKLLATVEAAQMANGPVVIFPRKVEGDAGYEVREGFGYTVRLQAVGEQAETASGPLSEPYPVIVSAPHITALVYDRSASQVLVRWGASREASVSGYVVEVTDGEQQTIVQTASCETFVKLEPGKGGRVRVSARNAWAQGPASAGIAVLTETVAVSKAMYADGWLHAAWHSSQHSGQTSYRIEVLTDSGEVVHVAESAGRETFLALKLQAVFSYRVRVTVLDGVSVGPPGDALDIITAVPGVRSIVTDETTINVIVDEPTQTTGIAGYRGYLYEGDILLAEAASMQTAMGSVILFPRKQEGDTGYEVREGSAFTVRVHANSEQAEVASGPLSEPYPVIASVPRMTALIYDRAASQVLVRWEASQEASVSGYAIYVKDGEQQKIVQTDGCEALVKLEPGKGGIVQVGACNPWARGPASAGIAVITETVAVSKAIYADGWLHAAWQASQHSEQTSYRIEVLTGGGEVVHAAENRMTEAWLNVALQQTGDYNVRITVLDGESAAGAPGNPLSILTAIPGTSSIVTDQKYISVSVKEPSRKSGIAGYRGYLYEGDKLLAEAASVQTADGPVVLFPCKGQDDADFEVREGFAYSIRLRAVGEQPQVLSGPLSTTYPIIVSVPRVTEAAMNGYAWRLGWTGSLEAAVQGYVVTVVDESGGDPLTFYTTDTHYQGDKALPAHYSIAKVQAVGEVSRGPMSQPIRLYGEGASYYVSHGESSQPAYLYRSYERNSSAASIRLYVPNVFLAEPQSGSDVFVWSKADDAPANYPYKLTVAETGPAWKFDAQSRSELWEAYRLLVKQLDEALVPDEGEAAVGERLLKPGVFHTLRQAIARSLPLLFTEQLQYAYGFNQENSYIDLVPGMRLRLEAAARQFVGAPSPITEHLNGFVPSGTLWLTIGEYWRANSMYTGFDAFLSLCERPSVPSPQTAGGAGGTLDLYSDNGGRRRLYRLLYPMNYPESSSMGHADRTDQILLLGADSYAQLEEATAQYVNRGNFDGYEDRIIVYTFRGRAVLVPEIPIEINSETCYVPVGTTLRDIAARFGGAPYPASQFLSEWRLERCTVNVVGTAAEAIAASQIPSHTEVRLSDSPMQTYSDDRSCFDLPLLHGDRIRLGQSVRRPAGGIANE